MNVGNVSIKQDDGSIKKVPVEEYIAMPGSIKMRLFLDMKLDFFDKQGNPMPTSVALKEIREYK